MHSRPLQVLFAAWLLSSHWLQLTLARDFHHEHHVQERVRRPACNPHSVKLVEESILKDPAVLEAFITKLPEVSPTGTWLQIGANTLDPQGHTYEVEDPLLKYLPAYSAYRKIFVEPVPHIFEQLRNNTRDVPNSKLVNAAIVTEETANQTVTIYCPTASEFYGWRMGICSIDEKVVLRAPGGTSSRKYEVTAHTMSSLFKEYSIEDVRIVMIDTEGFDVKLLKMLPFHDPNFSPDLVIYEHTEIDLAEHGEGQDFLRSHCYHLTFDRENAYGLKLF